MKNYLLIKRIYLVFLIAFLLFSSLNYNIYADTQHKSYNFRFNHDITLQGLFAKYAFFVNVDSHWRLADDNYFFVNLAQSSVPKLKNSTITFYINNTPIYSRLLAEVDGEQPIKIMIKKEYLQSGINELRITLYQQISDEPCTDDNNPANWVLIKKNSYLHLTYDNLPDSPIIADFPYPYLVSDSNQVNQSTLVLPTNYGKEEIKALLIISASFGKYKPYDNFSLKISSFDEKNLNNTNIIFMSLVDKLPKEISDLLTDQEKIELETKGMIKEIISPYNSSNKMLIITGKNEEILKTTAQTLYYPELVKQMTTSVQFIDPTNIKYKQEKILLEKSPNVTTLQDLGYSDVLLKGLFKNEADFGINIPKNKILTKDSYFQLKMRYAQNLDFNRSLVTIYLNEVPIGSKKLEQIKADNDFITVKIPPEYFNKHYLGIKVSFDLMFTDVFCDLRPEQNPWAVINKESYFYFTENEQVAYDLELYPGPFVKDKKINSGVIIPKNISLSLTNVLANIFSYLGRNSEEITDLQVLYPKEVENLESNNLIVIGTPETNEIIKKLNNKLVLPFSQDFLTYSSENINLLSGFKQKIATVQLIPSTEQRNNYLLVLSSTNDQLLKNLQPYLSDLYFTEKLQGELGIIDETGGLTTYSFKQNDKVTVPTPLVEDKELSNNLLANNNVIFFVLFFISLFLMVLVGLIFMSRKY